MTQSLRRTTLVFDLDGTLVDSAPDIAAAVNALFAELELPEVELALIRRMIGDGAPVLLERALRHVGAPHKATDLMPRFNVHYGENAARLTTLYPAVVETLTHLRGLGCRLGVCTNKPIGPTHAVLAALGLGPLMEAVVGGDSLPQRKPAPEPLLDVIQALDGTPESAVLIGDSAVDLACAEAAGVPAIIIPSGYGMVEPKATIIAAGFAALPGVIARL
ncbi:MAG TPA: phosphoglycolate phosphatase [Dongiaceae bacterium]|nr:phosphoglycolate phosphatase [Dongiaceae bacterium]